MAKIKTSKTGPVTVIDTDLGFNRILAELSVPVSIDVGVLEKDGMTRKTGSKDSTLAEVAAVHEFGAPERNIPQRSFLRSTVDQNKGYIVDIAMAVSNVISGLSAFVAMARVGDKATKDVTKKIQEGIMPALKPKTTARKGHSTPLIDTEQLINSIDFEVK